MALKVLLKKRENLHEVKYEPNARRAPNQIINIPKMQGLNLLVFTPVVLAGKAGFIVGQPFTGSYVVVYRHCFKLK